MAIDSWWGFNLAGESTSFSPELASEAATPSVDI
jgi:hypothetical protein